MRPRKVSPVQGDRSTRREADLWRRLGDGLWRREGAVWGLVRDVLDGRGDAFTAYVATDDREAAAATLAPAR